jgi:uncharacterized protein (TIGR03118 family)
VRHNIVFYFFSFLLIGFLLAATNAPAQTIGYRQTNLASSLPNVASDVAPTLINPSGMSFLTGQPFFIADNGIGKVTALDASGLSARPGSFTIPNAAGTGFDHPTGIVADQNSSFANSAAINPFIVVTEQGTIFTWGLDAQGDIPQQATLQFSGASAVFKGVAILSSTTDGPALAATDFHSGIVETFLPFNPGFTPVVLPGAFADPNLPAGFAPFGIQVIGRQVFVTYALQDAPKHDPVVGAGNGIVNIFDMDGNFVKRFATGGPLNAPWGIAQASANFGPFSNDILIGNVGDGTISAFDPASGHFLGSLLDGNGLAIATVGLNALALRADGFGDEDTLYFTSQVNSPDNGMFGAITPGLVSAIRLSLPDTTVDTNVTITASLSAGPGNTGEPTGLVTFLDGTIPLGTASLSNGSAAINASFAGTGAQAITAQYSGDRVFLPVSERLPLQVTGLTATVTLDAPTSAVPGSTIILTANINSPSGVPTGQVVFLDGNTTLGTSPLDATGVAILRVNTLAIGTHTLTAAYDGDGKFGATTSAGVTLDIANPDFSVATAPGSASVIAGQSTQFMLTVTPAGGFANSVAFSCSPVSGIACAFSPATVTPANRAASTRLTVTTSTSVSRYGLLAFDTIDPWALLFAFGLCSLALWTSGKVRTPRPPLVTATAAMTIVAMGLTIAGCGGYGNGTQANRGTATVIITAQSGSISHTTNVTVTVQ